jgi:hypothetical protein
MENRPLYKIECLRTVGTPASERLKVTALNLWENARLAAASRWSAHRTASPLFKKIGFFILRHSLLREREVEWKRGLIHHPIRDSQ